jgi:hypothetical protein
MSAIHEPDGVATAVEEALRTAVTAAATLGRHLATQRTASLRAAESRRHQADVRLRAQIDLDRLAMHAKLAPINQPRWWQTASPDDVLDAWTTAVEWREFDPHAARATTRIRSEFSNRHSIDLYAVERSIIDPGVQLDVPVEVEGALRDYIQARRITGRSGQRSVRELIESGGSSGGSHPRSHRRVMPRRRQSERER